MEISTQPYNYLVEVTFLPIIQVEGTLDLRGNWQSDRDGTLVGKPWEKIL